jgi:hypothetical protein
VKRRRALIFIPALAGWTCGCAPANIGQSPEILWWTDHETGDFSDWDQKGGYHWSAQGGVTEIVTRPNPTRSGQYSFRSSVTSPGTGTQSGAEASRSGGLPTEAYYSAWYYFPEAIVSTSYWLFFKFRSRTDPSDDTTTVNTWDLDVMTDSNGAMNLALYHHSNSDEQTAAALSIPIGRWFQVEAFLRAVNDNTGRITIWFDGVQAFDIGGQATMPSPYIEWSVGGIAEVISPNPAAMYIDDAAVSTKRLGPAFPVFWRGD